MRSHAVVFFSGIFAYLRLAGCNQRCQQVGYCSMMNLAEVPQLPSHITHLDLSLNFISEVDETSFLGLGNLQTLDLGSQKIKDLVIKKHAFRRLTNLTTLHLGDNEGLQIDSEAFVGLSNLQTLILLHSGLKETILSGLYLQPLVSLEKLVLFGNKIKVLWPALFFRNMTQFHELDVSLNVMQSICEEDLLGFQGKHFSLLKLSSVYMNDMNLPVFDWEKCGNPFRNMSFDTLDLSSDGFSVDKAQRFFGAIRGTAINHLILRHNIMGSSFGFSNLKDPDRLTFSALRNSAVKTMDLSKNSINVLKSSVFSAMAGLVSLTLAENKINMFEANAFYGLNSLIMLNLSWNLVGEIYEKTFEHMPNLLVLDLSRNHIGAFGYRSFTGLSNLQILSLSENSITEMVDLTPLPKLQELYLDNNKIASLYKLSDFAGSAVIATMHNNRLRNLGDLYQVLATFPNVSYIDFELNFLSSCFHDSALTPHTSQLIFLNLKYSALQLIWSQGRCLDLFDHLSKLMYLMLGYNFLQSLPPGIFSGLSSLHYLDLSYNSLTHLPPDIFPASLRALDLSFNFLSSPDPSVFQLLTNIDLSGNRFFCDCSIKAFQSWLNETTVAFNTPLSQLQCEFPKEQLGTPIANFNTSTCEKDDEQFLETLQLYLFIGNTTFIMLVALGHIAYVRFRGYCFILYKRAVSVVLDNSPKAPEPDGFQFDAYLCFSEHDYLWVEAALLKRLDSGFAQKNQIHCCFEARDFLPGEDHLVNIRSAIWGSRKIVCVLSKEFLKDGWCLEAFNLAQTRMLEELRDVLVVIVLGGIPHFQLRKYAAISTFLQKKEYLQWPEDSQDLEWFYDKLIRKIFKAKKVKTLSSRGRSNDIELQNVTASEGTLS
ncbi:toll-like receptor 5b [Denticeps clupeoides]|uniref:toll-like receptor 5b n=1 Tax=Denticeps clupeoides TaxID=299321 RepID=UPI0010A2B238|nr:toll-like receptor 5 [Denticeps clupeoides]